MAEVREILRTGTFTTRRRCKSCNKTPGGSTPHFADTGRCKLCCARDYSPPSALKTIASLAYYSSPEREPQTADQYRQSIKDRP